MTPRTKSRSNRPVPSKENDTAKVRRLSEWHNEHNHDGRREREGETGPLARKLARILLHGVRARVRVGGRGRVFLARATRRGEITQPAPETIAPAAYLLQPRGIASVKFANE